MFFRRRWRWTVKCVNKLTDKQSGRRWTHVVLKSAQLLLEDEVEEEAFPGAGGGVDIGCWADVGVAEVAARRLTGASLSGIRSA